MDFVRLQRLDDPARNLGLKEVDPADVGFDGGDLAVQVAADGDQGFVVDPVLAQLPYDGVVDRLGADVLGDVAAHGAHDGAHLPVGVEERKNQQQSEKDQPDRAQMARLDSWYAVPTPVPHENHLLSHSILLPRFG